MGGIIRGCGYQMSGIFLVTGSFFLIVRRCLGYPYPPFTEPNPYRRPTDAENIRMGFSVGFNMIYETLRRQTNHRCGSWGEWIDSI